MNTPPKLQGKLNWSDADIAKLGREVMDSQKIQLICSAFPSGKPHRPYLGSNQPPPPRGCVNCWKAYWWYVTATTPPHLREEMLSRAEKGVADAVQEWETGNWELELAAHPQISIEKDAMDDTTGVYTPQSSKNDEEPLN